MEKHAAVAQGATHCDCGAKADVVIKGEPLCKGCADASRMGAKEAAVPVKLRTLREQQLEG